MANYDKKNKIKNTEKITFFTILFVYAFLLIFYVTRNLENIGKYEFKSIIILILILMVILQFFIFYKKLRIENMFALIASILGIILMFALPPLQGPDERVHMVRSYDLAKGRVFFTGSEDALLLPASMEEYTTKSQHINMALHVDKKITKEQYKEAKKIPLNKELLWQYDADKTEAYSTIAYIPQALGMFIGDLLNLNLHYVFMLGRIINFIFWLTICYIALKIMPIKKELMMFVMLMPVCMQQAVILSPDAMLNSFSFLLIAYILNIKYEKKNFTIKNFIVIVLLCIGIVSVKLPYILISAMMLTIPKEKFKWKNILAKVGILFLTICIGFSTFFLWTKLSQPLKTEDEIKVTEYQRQVLIKAHKPLRVGPPKEESDDSVGYIYTFKQIILHPIEFTKIILRTIKMQGVYYIKTFVGYFGWLNAITPNYITILSGITLIFLMLNKSGEHSLKLWDRFVYFSIGGALILILFILLYKWNGADYTKVSYFIGSIQGRYFYPFIIPIMLSLSLDKLKFNLKKISWIIPSISIFILTICSNVILIRYWI